MRRLPAGLLFLLFLPGLSSAKPKQPPERLALDKNVEQAGGYSPFQRLETMTYEIEELIHSSSVPVSRAAERALRLHDGQGLRLREKDKSGALTVVLSSSPETATEKALLADTFWLFAPQWVRESGRPLEVLSEGFFLGRLLDRLAVGGEPLFPGGENLIFYLDKSEGKIIGASHGPGPTYVAFREPLTTNGFLVVPGVRIYFDKTQRKTRTVKLSNVVVNSYLDESLFTGGVTP